MRGKAEALAPFAPSNHRGRVALEQRMWARLRRAGLRQKQRGDEERMLRELDDPDLALVADPAHPETAGFELQSVVGVHPVVAVVPFGSLGHAVEPGGASARDQD